MPVGALSRVLSLLLLSLGGPLASTASASDGPSLRGGIPAEIPGTIQAADFDEGGPRLAYYDTIPGDIGGTGDRVSDVDIGSISVTNEPSSTPAFSHVYVIVMENKELTDIIGNPAAPYINSLASQYGLGANYTAITHPSLPNYMALTGGETFFSDDCIGCTVDAANVSDQVDAAGRSWKAYMEDMPAPCATTDTDLYVTKHNPFVHYNDIVLDGSRCQSQVVPLTDFYSDIDRGSIPDFVWITPNLCSDMHDCDVATGDGWLSTFVPGILATPDFASSVLFIVWDEGTTAVGGGGLVPLLVVSPMVPAGFQSLDAADHFALLRTIEEGLGLAFLGQAATARPLSEYFSGR